MKVREKCPPPLPYIHSSPLSGHDVIVDVGFLKQEMKGLEMAVQQTLTDLDDLNMEKVLFNTVSMPGYLFHSPFEDICLSFSIGPY